MAEGVVDVTVGAPPDVVWAKLGDFGGIGEYFPGIESCRLEGDDRVIGLFGMEIRERLMTRDDAGRTLTYSVVAGVPVESHSATITVEPEGDGSKVTWTYDGDARRDGTGLRGLLQGRPDLRREPVLLVPDRVDRRSAGRRRSAPTLTT